MQWPWKKKTVFFLFFVSVSLLIFYDDSISDEMVLVDSDDDEERKLLLSESPSLTSSPVITKELVQETARGSRRQQEAVKEARSYQLLPRLAWISSPSMEADKDCDKPDSFLLCHNIRNRDLYNGPLFNQPPTFKSLAARNLIE